MLLKHREPVSLWHREAEGLFVGALHCYFLLTAAQPGLRLYDWTIRVDGLGQLCPWYGIMYENKAALPMVWSMYANEAALPVVWSMHVNDSGTSYPLVPSMPQVAMTSYLPCHGSQ